MKVRIVVEDYEVDPRDDTPMEAAVRQRKTVVWSGDMEILQDRIYVTKISLIAEGEPRPICDIPFSLNRGYYLWIPAMVDDEEDLTLTLHDPAEIGKVTLEDTSNLRDLKVDDE